MAQLDRLTPSIVAMSVGAEGDPPILNRCPDPLRSAVVNLKLLCGLLLALVLAVPSAHATVILTTTLLGSNETPPNASTATGTALVTLESDNKTLDVNETFSGLTGGLASAAHIHCCALPGVAAIVAVPFTGFPNATSGHYINSFDLSQASTYNPAFITAEGGTVALAEAAFINSLETGLTYANIHDAVFPSGEIRGQLEVVPEPASLAVFATSLLGLGFAARRRRRK